MNAFQRLQQWHDSKIGLAVFAVLELALAYLFLSWAIDTGSLIDWFLTIVLLIGAIQNFVRLIWRLAHGR